MFCREALDVLCYIFQGDRIKFGKHSHVTYYFSDTLFGYKYKGSSPDDLSPKAQFTSWLSEYPKEFEFIAENVNKPSISEFKKQRLAGRHESYDTYIDYYVVIPAHYSTSKYNELENMFHSHPEVIEDMIINSGLVNCFAPYGVSDRLCFSVTKTGVYFRSGERFDMHFKPKKMLCRFWDYGMEDLPNRIDTITAFTTAFINHFFQLYPVQPGYDPRIQCNMILDGERVTCGGRINERECYVEILLKKIETPEPKPEGLSKW